MTGNVPPAAVEAFANQAIALIPEAQTTIERGDQKRKAGSGGGGGKSSSAPDAINFTASQAFHELHIVMMQILGDYDHKNGYPPVYRNALDAAKDIWAGRKDISGLDRIEEQLREGRHLLDKLAREIDLPPDPIPLGECECGEPMVAIEGQEEVVCKRCELPWEVDERRANRRNRVVGSLTTEVTAASASRILEQLGSKIPEGTIYRWAHEGKLVQSESGKYVLADILEVANNQKRGRPISLAD